MAGNLSNLESKQIVEAPLMRIVDQLATMNQNLETQNAILAKLVQQNESRS